MASNKKPRKAYKPKPVVKPLNIRNEQMMEFPGYAASLALGQEHLAESHIYDLLSNADMTKRIAPQDSEPHKVAQSMIYAIAEIQQRAQRVGKLGVTGDEFKVLRHGIGVTMEFLRSVSNIEIARASMEAIAEFNKTGVLRV